MKHNIQFISIYLNKVFLVPLFLFTYRIYISDSNCGKAPGLGVVISCTYLLEGEILHMWRNQNLVYDMDHTICANSITEYNFSSVVQNQWVLERQQKHFFCEICWQSDIDAELLWYNEPKTTVSLEQTVLSAFINCLLLFQALLMFIKPESEDKIACVKAGVVQLHSWHAKCWTLQPNRQSYLKVVYLFLYIRGGKGTTEVFKTAEWEWTVLLFCFLALHVWLPGSSWCVFVHLGERWCWWLLSGPCTIDWRNPPCGTGALEPSLLWQSSPWPAVGNGGVEKQLSKVSGAESSLLLSPFTYPWVTVQDVCVRDKQGERARAWDISDRQGLPNLRGKAALSECMRCCPGTGTALWRGRWCLQLPSCHTLSSLPCNTRGREIPHVDFDS